MDNKKQAQKNLKNETGKMLLIVVFIILLAIASVFVFSKDESTSDNGDGTEVGAQDQVEEDPDYVYESLYNDDTMYGPQPVAYCPQPSEVARTNLVTYRGQKGTYTFGMENQPETVYGICLNPTYAGTGEAHQIGLYLAPDGCTIWTPLTTGTDAGGSNAGDCDDPVVLLYDDLEYRAAAMYSDPTNYGVAWNLDRLDDSANSESSFILVRAVDLANGELLDMILLSFGLDGSGKYSLLSASNAIETDEGIIGLAADELTQMLSPNATSDRPRWLYPVQINTDFTLDLHGTEFFVRKVDSCYCSQYIDVATKDVLHSSWSKEYSKLYAVSANLAGDYAFATLYMIPSTTEDGAIMFQTIGYDIPQIIS